MLQLIQVVNSPLLHKYDASHFAKFIGIGFFLITECSMPWYFVTEMEELKGIDMQGDLIVVSVHEYYAIKVSFLLQSNIPISEDAPFCC